MKSAFINDINLFIAKQMSRGRCLQIFDGHSGRQRHKNLSDSSSSMHDSSTS